MFHHILVITENDNECRYAVHLPAFTPICALAHVLQRIGDQFDPSELEQEEGACHLPPFSARQVSNTRIVVEDEAGVTYTFKTPNIQRPTFHSFRAWKEAAKLGGYEIHPTGAPYSGDYHAVTPEQHCYGYWTGEFGNIGSANTGYMLIAGEEDVPDTEEDDIDLSNLNLI